MPVIEVNLADVQAFESLPEGSYMGEITAIKHIPAKETGKFPQMQVTYLVIDGDHTGRQQSDWLSFSPKALFRMKKWFNKFGLGDIPQLDFDDETDELNEPDLYGAQVIFVVTKRRDDPTRTNTELLSVESEAGGEAPAPPPPPTPAPPRATRRGADPKPEPEAEPEEAEAEVEEEAEAEEEAPAETPAPRAASPARRAASPSRTQPQRRTLR